MIYYTNSGKNGWAIYRLMQRLEMQNNDSSGVRKAFEVAWQSAIITLIASRIL